MDFDKVVEKRHSVRAFENKMVNWKRAIDLIEAANKTPAAGGNQHIKFIIVERPDLIEKIAKLADQDWISEASIVLIVVSDDKYLEDLYGERGRVYSRQQAGAVIQNILLKLTDLGLGGCWVGSYDDDMLRSNFKIPPSKQVEAIIPIGYERSSVKSKNHKEKKKSIESSIYWEEWNQSRRPALFKEPGVHNLPK